MFLGKWFLTIYFDFYVTLMNTLKVLIYAGSNFCEFLQIFDDFVKLNTREM